MTDKHRNTEAGERSALGSITNQPQSSRGSSRPTITPSHPTSPLHHRSNTMSTIPSSQAAPTAPSIEPNPNPNIPANFTLSLVEEFADPTDPEYTIFDSIQSELEDVLDAVQPPFVSALVNYGTCRLHVSDKGYDAYKNPKVLSIEIDSGSIQRWPEVAGRIERIVQNAYSAHSRLPPPIRYYRGGTGFCSSRSGNPQTSSTSFLMAPTPSMPDQTISPIQEFQDKPKMGHSIGIQGDKDSLGTMGHAIR